MLLNFERLIEYYLLIFGVYVDYLFEQEASTRMVGVFFFIGFEDEHYGTKGVGWIIYD